MKTTKEDFKLFERECRKWIDFYGLKDWYVIFRHLDIEKQHEGATVGYDFDLEARVVCITLNKTLNVMEEKRKVLKVAAFHEMTELLLARLIEFAERGPMSDAVPEEIHAIIRRMENSVYENKR